ncbi:universal stress protein [Cellulomonas sp. PhB143]|uniref:universal stress protein n=1 Tax=Cellulomonas sp. PhB143 TaxID=2485186 RepID=UPI000FB4ADA7|nr:universal stress protein [Cellulomonas sp. PhB143]ROS75506.1 universal stress protein family protein [Cellulomonas sp. PhB143]
MPTSDPRPTRAARRPVRDEPRGPVVVSLGGSRAGRRALEWAAGEAAVRGSALRIVHTIALPLFPADPWQWAFAPGLGLVAYDVARAELADAVGHAHAIDPGLEVSTELLHGPPGPGLLACVRGDDALVVVGRRRRGAARPRALAPAVAWGALRRAGRPAVVVDLADARERGPSTGRVLVALDGTHDPSPVLDVAFRAAARRGAGLTLLHAWPSRAGGGTGTGASPGAGSDEHVDALLGAYRDAFAGVGVRHRQVALLAEAVAAETRGVAMTVVAAPTGGGDLGGRSRARRLVRAARGPVTLVPVSPARPGPRAAARAVRP